MKAVIFDMDGVLVDSFEANRKAFDEVLSRRYGFNVSKEEFMALFGSDPRDITKALLKNHGVTGFNAVEELYAEKRVIFNRLMDREIKIFPGVLDTLKKMRERDLKLAIASSNSRESIGHILKKTGLNVYFQATAGFEDTTKAKPDPEIFLKAAVKLGVKPGECGVIEDSLHGIEAGKKAGMKVVGVQTGFRSRKELMKAGADLVVETLEHLDVDDLRGEKQ